MRVLLVEDDPLQRSAMVELLEGMRHTVCWASTGDGALELLRTEEVDVVLLDLELGPGIDGWEVMRRKLLDARTAPIPVIVCTGMSMQSVHEREENPLDSAILMISKPVDVRLLERALEMLAGTVRKGVFP